MPISTKWRRSTECQWYLNREYARGHTLMLDPRLRNHDKPGREAARKKMKVGLVMLDLI